MQCGSGVSSLDWHANCISSMGWPKIQVVTQPHCPDIRMCDPSRIELAACVTVTTVPEYQAFLRGDFPFPFSFLASLSPPDTPGALAMATAAIALDMKSLDGLG